MKKRRIERRNAKKTLVLRDVYVIIGKSVAGLRIRMRATGVEVERKGKIRVK